MLRNNGFTTDALLDLAWRQTWQVAAVAALVAIVTVVFCRRRPHLAYLLWLLVLVKAVTPPVWSSPTGAFSWTLAERVQLVSPNPPPFAPADPSLPAIEFTESTRPAQVPADPAPSLVHSPVVGALPPSGLALHDALLIAWATGAIGLGVWLTVNWLLLARRIRRTTESPDRALADRFAAVKRRIGVHRPVRLRISQDQLGPAALGWWRGTVLVPQSLIEQSSSAELAAIFAHELVHLRRFDPLVGTLQLAVQCLWWWHPAIWWANRQVRIERERSCDEAVLAQVDVRPADYARLLVELLRRRRTPVPAIFWSGMRSTSATTARVRHVLETTTFRRRSPLTAWLLAGLALVIVLPGAGSRFITAAPPEQAAAQNAAPRVDQQPVSPEVPVAPAPEWANRKQTPEEAAAFQELTARGAVWSFAAGPIAENPQRRWAVTLPNSFDPGDAKLPLAPLSRILLSVTVGQFGQRITTNQLRAQLLALKDLPAGTMLSINYTSENTAALDALPSIPKLTNLGLLCTDNGPSIDWANPQTRPFAISKLQRLTHLTTSAADGDLPEFARLTDLEHLGLIGSVSAAGVDQLRSLTRLKSLNLQGALGPGLELLDLACLDGMNELERLNIGGTLIPTDAAAKRIGARTKLHDLSISVDGMSNAGLAAIAEATSLRTVHLSVGGSPGVSARGFAALSALKNLDRLSILGWAAPGKQPLELTDESLTGWENLVNLRFLVISHCSISDAGIRTLSSLPILHCLQLEGPLQVTDAGVAKLKNAPELGALVLTGSEITGAGLAPLKDCKSLALVNLSGNPLTDAGLEALAAVKLLSQLDVSGTKVTDKGLAALTGRVPQLTRLNLARTVITDAGLSELKKLSHLKELNLADTKVSVSGIGELLDANRQLMVWSVDPQTPQTRAFDPGIFQGTFQPIDANEVLGELTAAKTAKADKGGSTPTIVANASERFPTAEIADESREDTQTPPALTASPAKEHTTEGSTEDIVKQLQQLGLHVMPGDQSGQRFYTADFAPDFEYRGRALPLEKLPDLRTLWINRQLDLTEAQIVDRLKALQQLRPETHLVLSLKVDQGAAFDELANIPRLQILTLTNGMGPLVTDDQVGRKVSLGTLAQLRRLTILDDFNEAILTELAPLKKMQHLYLGSTEHLSTDLSFLESMRELESLHTANIYIRDAGFELLGRLKSLQSLQTSPDSVSVASVSRLAELPRLRTLSFSINASRPPVDPQCLAALGQLQQIESLSLVYSYLGPFPPLAVQTTNPITDEVVAQWTGLERLKFLQIVGGELGNESLLAIGQLRALEQLILSGTVRAKTSGLEALSALTELRAMWLELPDWNGEGFEHLAKLTNLERLAIINASNFSDASLEPISALAELNMLILKGASIRGQGLAQLNVLTHLEKLSLRDNPIADSELRSLAGMNLRKLDLEGTNITDATLPILAESLPNLTELNVSDTKVTNNGLIALEPLGHLKSVVARDTAVTDVGAKNRPWRVTVGSYELNGRNEFIGFGM